MSKYHVLYCTDGTITALSEDSGDTGNDVTEECLIAVGQYLIEHWEWYRINYEGHIFNIKFEEIKTE